ncbi:DUF1330 domain-containing protein [Streptomyces sp. NPDC047072]|uniref:DUF1330 domain-containing protein n=1 Tax=Streptomyces sp. NPDC047072 TaxID=3154809 RepID=UPI0033C0BF3E
MPKAYVIFTESVKDPAGMAAYGRAAGPTLAGTGARLVANDSAPETLEGDWFGDTTVVLEFPSVEAARAWYASEAYQEARKLRQAAAETNAVIVTAAEPPSARG